MNALIKIEAREISGAVEQTCDARDLHSFLGVETRFNDWIARRVEEYGFVEGKDFYSFLSKTTEGGRSAKEYSLTLDMGKELAMVERNEKGKQARQYFLDCERRAKGQISAVPPAPTFTDAFKLVPLVVRAARALGLDKNAAAISANQAVMKLTGTNVLKLLGHQHLAAADSQRFARTREARPSFSLAESACWK